MTDAVVVSMPTIADGRLLIDIKAEKASNQIYFTVPQDFHVHFDCVASAVATLLGTDYKEIEFQFPISDRCAKGLESGTKAIIRRESSVEPRVPGARFGLNFSGGFDSLTAYLMAPEQFRIAVDFGGPFKREREFFETLQPEVICETDFRSKGYANATWQFMGAASILYADYLNLAGMGFGTIFEATPANYRLTPPTLSVDFRTAAGLFDSTMTRGLTEFGTTLILVQRAPELLEKSLRSVAAAGSEKLFRKRLLIETARHFLGGPLPNFTGSDLPRTKPRYGQSFAIDFLTLAFAGLYGVDVVASWTENVEEIDGAALRKMNFDWLFKYNPIFQNEIPLPLADTARSTMIGAGVESFNDQDSYNYRSLRSLMTRYPFPS